MKLTDNKTSSSSGHRRLLSRHPVLANFFIIIVVAILGLMIVYFSIAIFTKHGQTRVLPKVENMSYSQAVELLYDKGFRVDIRDSVYRDDVKPGYVIEQFPKANSIVKPGRKVFLYINAVHPKEVVIDPDNNPVEDALKSYSFRQGIARLEELGFKNVKVVRVLGESDRIVKVTANGRTVKKTQKVPVNARIVVEVCDGRLRELRDSLQNEEYLQYATDDYYNGADSTGYGSSSSYDYPDYSQPEQQPDEEPEEVPFIE